MRRERVRLMGWLGGMGLKVGFQPLKMRSQTTSWIRWCMQVYAGVGVVGELIWTGLVWAERSTPDSFEWQATDSISSQVSSRESLRPLY